MECEQNKPLIRKAARKEKTARTGKKHTKAKVRGAPWSRAPGSGTECKQVNSPARGPHEREAHVSRVHGAHRRHQHEAKLWVCTDHDQRGGASAGGGQPLTPETRTPGLADGTTRPRRHTSTEDSDASCRDTRHLGTPAGRHTGRGREHSPPGPNVTRLTKCRAKE